MNFPWTKRLNEVRIANELHSILWSAVEANNVEAAHHAILNGADFNCCRQSNDTDSPLLVVARYGNIEMANMLLKHGAKMSNRHDTALSGAAYNGHLEMVNLLLQHGSNVDELDDAGKTAMDYAAIGRFPNRRAAIIAALKQHQQQ